MEKFVVKVEETLSKEFCIEAQSREDAIQIAKENYKNAQEDYILSAEDFSEVNFY